MNIIEAFKALQDGKRVEDYEGDEIVLSDNKYLRYKESVTETGAIPSNSYFLKEDSFRLIEDSNPELKIRESESYACHIIADKKNLIMLDTIEEINSQINRSTPFMRLYKNKGFDFKIEELHDRYQVFITHKQED